jgi:uncharacterized SAM-binding protein YcdF (DUF218 family)
MPWLRSLAVLGGLVVANLVLSAAVWWLAPSVVTPRWQGACSPDTAVAVFYGGLERHTGARVDRAAEILRSCPDFEAILLGGARENFDGSREMYEGLLARGIRPSGTHLDGASFHSRGNLAALDTILGETGIARVILVSDALHLLRIERLSGPLESRAGEVDISFAIAWPHGDRWAFWWRPNYALAAWIAELLPDHVFDALLRQARWKDP